MDFVLEGSLRRPTVERQGDLAGCQPQGGGPGLAGSPLCASVSPSIDGRDVYGHPRRVVAAGVGQGSVVPWSHASPIVHVCPVAAGTNCLGLGG